MPNQMIPIAVVFILCTTGLILGLGRMIVGYLSERAKARGVEEAGLTESQLRRLVQEAVEEAVAPLVAQLEERDSQPLLEEMGIDERADALVDDLEAAPERSGRRQRA